MPSRPFLSVYAAEAALSGWRSLPHLIGLAAAQPQSTGHDGNIIDLQRRLDGAMGGISRQVVEAVQLADRRKAADAGRGVAVGERGEVGTDSLRRRRDGDKTMRGAPGGVVRPVRLVGPPGSATANRPARRAGSRFGDCEDGRMISHGGQNRRSAVRLRPE
jgi:hypothetical protein